MYLATNDVQSGDYQQNQTLLATSKMNGGGKHFNSANNTAAPFGFRKKIKKGGYEDSTLSAMGVYAANDFRKKSNYFVNDKNQHKKFFHARKNS
jgi:hypothetical protein